jgi:hypothetical protein
MLGFFEHAIHRSLSVSIGMPYDIHMRVLWQDLAEQLHSLGN